MAITSTGLGSGLDINKLVAELVTAESTPATNRINRREAKFSAELSAVGTFKGSLSDFRSSVFSLTLASTFSSKTATSSNTSLFTASATYSATVANYSIKVNQLAQAHSLELAAPVHKDAKFNTGALKISVGSGTSREIAINSTNNTLEGIAKAINGASGIGVTATILSNGDTRQLSLKSTATGAANTIHVAVTGEAGSDLSLASTFNYLDSLKLGEPVDKAALFNAGTLTIGVGPNSKDVVIAENQTLEQIAAAINGVADIGVTATIQESGDNRQISLKPKDGSSASAINIAVTGETGTNLSLATTFSHTATTGGMKQVQAAQDASITIDGSNTATTSSSNLFLFTSGSLSGVSLEVKSVGADAAASTAKLDIGQNTTAAIEAVSAFVKGFNSLASSIKTLTSYNATTKTTSPLQGDAGVRSVNFQLRRMLSASVGDTSAFNNLSSIGIEAQRDGTLKFDSSKLKTALETDPSGVATLFTGAEASNGAAAIDGLGNRFKIYLDDVLSSNGSLNSRLNTLNKNIASLADDRETLNTRLQKLQTRYMKQFSAMDSLLGRLSGVSSFLTQQLEGIANIYKKK